MGNSLQDQLKALGLAKEKPGSGRAKTNEPVKRPRKKVSGKKDGPRELTLEQAFALRKAEEKKQADLARRKKQEQDRLRRQLNNAIREIVNTHRLNRDDAEVARNFMFRERIRKVHVTPDQLVALNAGELGIVYLSGGYHLLAKEHVDAVSQLSKDHVPDLNAGSDEDDDGEFPIPDDLIW